MNLDNKLVSLSLIPTAQVDDLTYYSSRPMVYSIGFFYLPKYAEPPNSAG